MKEQWFDRCAASEPSRDGDADPDRPTLVQVPEHLLENERAPRTLSRDNQGHSLEQLEAELEHYADSDAPYDPWRARPRVEEPSHIGQVLDKRYVVEALIARGGMGIVYRCRHQLIDRKFAVKIIRASMAHLPDAPRRFLIEAKAASTIGNEHIIDVVDYGTLADGSAYLVMELLEGVPLSEVIAKHERLPVGRIAGIAAQVCEGLRAAHEAGIVHRDLKPENIFLSSRKAGDFVKVLDFGIAKMMSASEPLTKRGLIVGTPHYMAPEQAAGATVDARGDIYSLGIILYELSTGKVPFDATHYMAVLAKHMSEAPPPFASLCLPTQLPRELEAIVRKCLAKRPEDRFQSMGELMEALEELGRRHQQPSGAFREPSMPLAAAFREPGFRSSGTSLPAAGRSLIAQPRPRAAGLVLSLLGVLTLAGISLWRLQAPDERHAARSARAEAPAELLPAPPARGLPAPAADSHAASSASAPSTSTLDADASGQASPPGQAPAGEAPPAEAAPASQAPRSEQAPPPGEAGAPGEPLSIVELTDGKSVEIEARTRLSLRLSREPEPTEPALRPSPRRTRKPAAGAHAKERTEPAPERAPSELMNPWPTPAIGPARE
jgi:serine/threonine protein kinase